MIIVKIWHELMFFAYKKNNLYYTSCIFKYMNIVLKLSRIMRMLGRAYFFMKKIFNFGE